MMWVAVITGFIVGAVFGMILLGAITREKAAEEYRRGYEEGMEAEYASIMKAEDKLTKGGDDLCD